MDNIQLYYIDNEINKFEMINKIEGYEQQTTL